MAVLNTTSPTDWPEAPTEMPSNTVPSSRTRIAVSVTGVAYVGLQETAGALVGRPEAGRFRRARMIPARGIRRQHQLPVSCRSEQVAQAVAACRATAQAL